MASACLTELISNFLNGYSKKIHNKLETKPLLKIINTERANKISVLLFLKKNKINNNIDTPSGDTIRGSNLLSKYVSKNNNFFKLK